MLAVVPVTTQRRGHAGLLVALGLGLGAAFSCSNGTEGGEAEPPRSVGLEDVSVLYPLPVNGDDRALLAPDREGPKGQLLPYSIVKRLPQQVETEERQATYERMRLVSFRVHPCFPRLETVDTSLCRYQLSLIYQPVKAGAGATVATDDAALHAFHELSRAEFSAFLAEYAALRAHSPADRAAPLGVHSLLAAQGLHGDFAAQLGALIPRYTGVDNLVRIAYFLRRAGGAGWLLGAQGVEGGSLGKPEVVSTLDQAEQHWGNNTGEDVPTAANFKGDFKPASATDLALLPLVGDSSAALVAPEADLRAAIEKTYWIEDPTKNHLESLDCVACHVASQARWWSERARQIDTSSSPAIYRSDHWNLTTTTQVKGRTNALRGFGYYDDQVAITQRTVNDSAAEADYINQQFLAR